MTSLAVQYLKGKLRDMSDTYTLALIAYAFELAGDSAKETALEKLMKKAIKEGETLLLYKSVDIRLRSHGLEQIVDDKSVVASCQQTCCKLIVRTYKLFQQVVASLQMTRCNKPDFFGDLLQLDGIGKFVATC